MNNFIYLISALHLCHLPIMSPPFPMFLRWTSELQLPWDTSLTLSMAMPFFLSMPPSLCGWLFVLVPSRGQFHVCTKHNCFLWNEWEHHSGTPFAFSWDTQPGVECLFDHSPFPSCKYLHFHLWGPNPGDGVLETCGVLSTSLAERSSAWSWCRWSCPGVLWS